MNDRQLLRDIYSRGFSHLSAIAQALKRIQSETQNDQEADKKSIPLSMVFRAINDVLHAGYISAPELFPESDLKDFLKELDDAYKDAVAKNLFSPCPACCCKSDDESPSRNTDQAQ